MKNYYDILKVKNTANADEIKNAYRALAKKYHPDLNTAVGAKETLVEVNEAYDTLGDEKKKADYDKKFADFQNRQKFVHNIKTNSYANQPPQYPKTGPQPYPKTETPPSQYSRAGTHPPPPPPQYARPFQPPPQPPPFNRPNTFAHQTSTPPPGFQPRPPSANDTVLQKHLKEMEVKRAFSEGFAKGSGEAQDKSKITINQLQLEIKILTERNTELHKKNLQYFSQIEKLNQDISKEREELEEQIQQIEKIAEEQVGHGGNCVKNCPNEVEVENIKIEQTILTARVDRFKETVKQLEEENAKKEEELKELHSQLETLNNHIDELDDYIDSLTGESEEDYLEEEEEEAEQKSTKKIRK